MMKTFLHVGCGHKTKDQTTLEFQKPSWNEIRLDINPEVQPDIIGSTTDLSNVNTVSMDAVFSSHNIEHIYPHEVQLALLEYLRILNADGIFVVTCPDLQSVCAVVADDKLTDKVYDSPAGPITPLDILYGHMASVAAGNIFMAHKSGFTRKTLTESVIKAGFGTVIVRRREHPYYDLWAIATKSRVEESRMKELAEQHFPN
jgi:predicted SAM-dependent methyltransferase